MNDHVIFFWISQGQGNEDNSNLAHEPGLAPETIFCALEKISVRIGLKVVGP
jgi:hypothetical protein